jgi:hypothetical protein
LDKAVPAWSTAQQKVKTLLGEGIVDQLNQAMKRISEATAAG